MAAFFSKLPRPPSKAEADPPGGAENLRLAKNTGDSFRGRAFSDEDKFMETETDLEDRRNT